MDEILKQIDYLNSFVGVGFPILSVYLSTIEKKVPHPSYFITQLHSLIAQNLTPEQRKYFRKDIQKIERYLRNSFTKTDSNTLIFFSSDTKLWQVLKVEFFLSPTCVTLSRPYLKPIIQALNTYQKYLVLLADQKHARLFTVHLDKIEQFAEFVDGQVPQQGHKILSHIEDHLHQYIRSICQRAQEFAVENDIHFLIVGGHKSMISQIKKALVYPLDKMLIGEFVTELNLPLNEIFVESKKIVSVVDHNQ